MSVYQWIESRVPGGHSSPFGMLLDVAYNIEYGAETTDQSSLNLVYLLGYGAKPGNFLIFGKSDERFHIDGGNEQLPAAIRDDLVGRGIPVLTNHRVTAVTRNNNGTYTLAFNGRPAVVVDHVVLAIPFAVLRTLDYRRAGFDSLKTTSIQQLGSGRNSKLALQFNSRFWNGEGAWPGISNGASTADTGYQQTWEVSRGQPGNQGILVDYSGGTFAASFKPSTRIFGCDRQREAGDCIRQDLPEPAGAGVSRHLGPLERQGNIVRGGAGPEPFGVLLVLPRWPVHVVWRLREGSAGQRPFRGRAHEPGLPGIHGGRCHGRRPRRPGDPRRPQVASATG